MLPLAYFLTKISISYHTYKSPAKQIHPYKVQQI